MRRRASGQLCVVVESELAVRKATMVNRRAIIVLRLVPEIGEGSTDNAEPNAGAVESGVNFSEIINPCAVQSLGLERACCSEIVGSGSSPGSAEKRHNAGYETR